MKNLFLKFILIFSLLFTFLLTVPSAQAETVTVTKKNLFIEFQKVNSENIKVTIKEVFNGLNKFSEISELTVDDVELVASVLKTLVIFNTYDPSRTAEQIMTESYIKNEAVYKLAFERLSLSEKKILDSMFSMLKRLNSKGNG